MNKKSLKIGNKEIGEGKPVFIIAEMSGNHKGSLERAKEMVKAACEAGADAIKTQTYTPEDLTINCEKDQFMVKVNAAGGWSGRSLYSLYQEAHTPYEWQPELKKVADQYGIPLFTSVFDEKAVDFWEKLGTEAYKIASFEIVDLELLKKVAKTKKPVIISRGMASVEEIELAIKTLKENGTPEVAVLHCISSYPALPEEMNLATIPDIAKRFNVVTGLSDHTLGTDAAVASVALGASIIEKHFTLSRAEGGVDAGFSLEPAEFKELVRAVRVVEKSIGKIQYGSGSKEAENAVFRRSLYIIDNMKAGDLFTRENVRCIRPGYGLAPRQLPEILGKKASKDIERGTALDWDLIS
ncbi:MAG: pseudaminic acid synthase [Candidatus Pacebacteria bacterium]|nr:pseudaminic acid synthase [Candidatus Paceibacterota bacterium]